MNNKGLLAALLSGNTRFGPSGEAGPMPWHTMGGQNSTYGLNPPEPWQRRANTLGSLTSPGGDLSMESIEGDAQTPIEVHDLPDYNYRDKFEEITSRLREREEYIRELESILNRYQPLYHQGPPRR